MRLCADVMNGLFGNASKYLDRYNGFAVRRSCTPHHCGKRHRVVERRLRRYGHPGFGRRKEETRAANGKMKLFLLRLLCVAAQIREMIDVAKEFDFFHLDGVLFHKRERIVAAMNAGQVEIRKIF